MFRSLLTRHAVAVALVGTALLGTGSSAQAAFAIAINGVTVVTDGGATDSNATTGVIGYAGTFNGYAVEFTSRTNLSTPTVADITTSQILIRNVSGTTPLTITVTEDAFNVPLGGLGSSNLFSSFTRNISSGIGTSGTASMTSTATSAQGGGTSTTDPIVFTGAFGADFRLSQFDRTSAFFTLTTTVTVNGLRASDAVVLTADSSVTNRPSLVITPAPAGLVLLLTGVPVFWLRRRMRRGPAAA